MDLVELAEDTIVTSNDCATHSSEACYTYDNQEWQGDSTLIGGGPVTVPGGGGDCLINSVTAPGGGDDCDSNSATLIGGGDDCLAESIVCLVNN